MAGLYWTLLIISVIVAILFTFTVVILSKGDAMSGSGQIRTTFKGKAAFDDLISRATLILGIAFMALMLVLDMIASRM
jgi:preprotein translocase subunit SecG